MTRQPRISFPLAIASLALLAAGCSPYDPDLGDVPFQCGTEEGQDNCPSGYSCIDQGAGEAFCIRDGFTPERAGPSGFRCNRDGQIEPNESADEAFVTPIGEGEQSIIYPNMAICPGQDIDYYTVRVPEGISRIFTEIRFNAAFGELVLQVLDAEGEVLREGTAPPQEENIRVGQLGNLDPGLYNVAVFTRDGSRNNYSIDLAVR